MDRQRRLTKAWYDRVQHGDRRQFFSLGTPNKAAAVCFDGEEDIRQGVEAGYSPVSRSPASLLFSLEAKEVEAKRIEFCGRDGKGG